MLKNKLIRLVGAGILIIVITATALAATPAHSDKGNVLCAGVSNSVGLVLDNHQNLYMADRTTGDVFRVSQGSAPILLGRVPEKPTALAVDKLKTVFISTESGTIYRMGLDGTVNEACRCPARPIGLSVDRDGCLIVATDDGVVRKVARNVIR